MPRPPYSGGRHTAGQATKHWPPAAVSAPAHRNPRLLLSTSLNIHSGILMEIMAWMHLEDITDFTIVSLPALFIRLAFQVGIDATDFVDKRL